MKSVREIIEDHDYEDIVIFDNPSYDSAFIGISYDNRAVYDYDLMIEYLVMEDNMSEEDASDFISYNTIRSLSYFDKSPIVLYRLDRG